ncbi:dihydroneopterin aldolase [Sphingomonas sp. RG327]|jgi:dihydroneopterin aldolase|uniref:dihydroneopterin aldolase n=1 Tax=Sphingomonas anseongensis TaxID=2908207 RepID=A0ABT0RC03_9SPHN|nr:dihydroneopterin aldolase [Sphingomonas anseongensis]MCL6677785.1 dihydroneopterin aldolase [Sphingomonas anseongensis]
MMDQPKLSGLVPDRLRPRSAKIVLESLEVMADIGFHEFEVGSPQRLLITVEVWLDDLTAPEADDPGGAWDYDHVRQQVIELAGARRYNLQETLAEAIYQRLAAMRGVKALRVTTGKPDIYADAKAVGVEIASFAGSAPQI